MQSSSSASDQGNSPVLQQSHRLQTSLSRKALINQSALTKRLVRLQIYLEALNGQQLSLQDLIEANKSISHELQMAQAALNAVGAVKPVKSE